MSEICSSAKVQRLFQGDSSPILSKNSIFPIDVTENYIMLFRLSGVFVKNEIVFSQDDVGKMPALWIVKNLQSQ